MTWLSCAIVNFKQISHISGWVVIPGILMQRGYLCKPTVSREDLAFAQTPLNKETRKLSLLKLEKMKSKTEAWNLISFGIAFHWLCKQPKKFAFSVINPFIHNKGGFKGEGERGVRPSPPALPPFLFFSQSLVYFTITLKNYKLCYSKLNWSLIMHF